MNSNLQTGMGFKEVLLKKLSYAVMCSVLTHVTVVFVYILIINFSVQPIEWLRHVFNTLTSLSTWLYFIPFTSIIFAQIMICAKDYVLKSTYEVTRFQRFISIFSIRTFTLGFLHIAVGGLGVWLYLSLHRGQYQHLYVKCTEKDYCLVEGSFFMILGGSWTGLYFFLSVYMSSKNQIFPVVQQPKLLHFKASFLPLLKQSKSIAFYPTVYYFFLYYSCGSYLYSFCAHFLRLRLQDESFSLWLYVYAWVFAILYIINMNLMRFFFELFLTEPSVFPINPSYDEVSLSDALLLNNMPIMQHLACLDLYLLSLWSPERRQALFTLSQPGKHAQTWNNLLQGALKLLTEFTDTLNKSADILLNAEERLQPVTNPEVLLNKSESLLTKSSLQTSQPSSSIRRLCLLSPSMPIELAYLQEPAINAGLNSSSPVAIDIFSSILGSIKNLWTVKYVFGELPEAHIQHCLTNSQLIVWTTQGLANVVVASFNEDPYGVVQKDLPVLITSLVQLKQSVEKLNKIPAFSRKGPGFDDFSFKMKTSVNISARRSLCNICRTFGKYFNDIPLNKDIAMQLKCYM